MPPTLPAPEVAANLATLRAAMAAQAAEDRARSAVLALIWACIDRLLACLERLAAGIATPPPRQAATPRRASNGIANNPSTNNATTIDAAMRIRASHKRAARPAVAATPPACPRASDYSSRPASFHSARRDRAATRQAIWRPPRKRRTAGRAHPPKHADNVTITK